MDSIFYSSTEDLSTDEKIILATRKRQEPQGREQDDRTHKGEPQVVGSLSNGFVSSTTSGLDNYSLTTHDDPSHVCLNTKSSNMSLDSNAHSTYNTLIIHHSNSSLLDDTWIPATHEFTSVGIGSSNNCPNHPLSSSTQEYSGIAEIPRGCRDNLPLLAKLGNGAQQISYAGSTNENLLRASTFSKSQPELAKIALTNQSSLTTNLTKYDEDRIEAYPAALSPHISTSNQILDLFMRENAHLRIELLNAQRKLTIIQKLEAELTKLQASHGALLESTARREYLERTARSKLSAEVKRLAAVNREIVYNSMQNLSQTQSFSELDVDILKKELLRKELGIAQLMLQNQNLMTAKEKQDIEVAAQRATLEEQRNHIDILETALSKARNNATSLEQELQRQTHFMERISASPWRGEKVLDKSDGSEKSIGSQPEAEIKDLKLKSALSGVGSESNRQTTSISTQPDLIHSNSLVTEHHSVRHEPQPPPYPGVHQIPKDTILCSSKVESQNEIQKLQQKLKISDEKIQMLESHVAKWQQHYTNKVANASRSSATSFLVSTEDVKNDNNAEMRENLRRSQTKVVDLESKIKDFESSFRERQLQRVISNSTTSSAGEFSGFEAPNITRSCNAPPLSPVYMSDCISKTVAASAIECPSYWTSVGKSNYMNEPFVPASQNPESRNDSLSTCSKIWKYDTQPPNYCNLPVQLRLGGSGSSLGKHVTEDELSGLSESSGHGSLPASRSRNESKSIDEQLKELDQELLSRDSLIQALQREMEKHPSHYWNV